MLQHSGQSVVHQTGLLSQFKKGLDMMLMVCLSTCVCILPCTALTWLTFSSISDTATFFFLSGLSFQYIIMAALRTASSNLLSVDSFRMSASFSGVIPGRGWNS